MLLEGCKVFLHGRLDLSILQFVCFGEDDGEGYTMFAKEREKSHVNGLRVVTDVDEDKEAGELFAFEHIVANHLAKLFHCLFASLGIAVPGQIDEIPIFVDEEVIDAHGLAWCGRGEGEVFPFCQGIDERGFAYVASSDEGIFGASVGRTFVCPWLTADVFSGGYFHGGVMG